MVEKLLTLDFNILGVVIPLVKVPEISKENLNFKKKNTLKMVLLNKIPNKLSTADISKLQLATQINEEVICLFDFSKGLNFKELNYFKRLFKDMTKKYNKKIILVSRDVDFLAQFADTFAIYQHKIVYYTKDIFDDALYKYIDMPKIVKFIKYANLKNANLTSTVDINELIKDIYRRKHEN